MSKLYICEHKVNGGCASETCPNAKPRTQLTADCIAFSKRPIKIEAINYSIKKTK